MIYSNPNLDDQHLEVLAQNISQKPAITTISVNFSESRNVSDEGFINFLDRIEPLEALSKIHLNLSR